jgi:hypothetical protein
MMSLAIDVAPWHEVGRFVTALGDGVLADWRRHGFSVRDFAAIAEGALCRMRPQDEIDGASLIEWTLQATNLPYQQHFESPFGQPPLTVYWHSHFHIQALFWTTSTTAVHDHSFAGAFAIIDGASLQSLYSFDCHEEISPTLWLGDLALRRTEILDRGAVQRILVGDDFIHSAFHLESPSVTLVVRTHSLTSIRSRIFEYLRPHIALDPSSPDQQAVRQIQCLGLLATIGSPGYVRAAVELIQRTDTETTFLLLRDAWRRTRHTADAAPLLIAAARDRWGDRVDRFIASLDEERRQAVAIPLRERITRLDLRLLIGLLLTQATRRQVLNVVQTWTASTAAAQTPAAIVARGIQELGRLRALPITIDDSTTAIVEHVLEDSSDDPRSILERLDATGTRISPEDLVTRMRPLASQPLLKALFVTN